MQLRQSAPQTHLSARSRRGGFDKALAKERPLRAIEEDPTMVGASRSLLRTVLVGTALIGVPGLAVAARPPAAEAGFLAENQAAMGKMMAGMDAKPTGDVDADFVAMMVPHHQGAIDMAQAELRYGRNEQLRRMAQEIIVEQRQEIAAMRLALGQPLRPSTPAPEQAPRSPK
jgi:hypothetical protein